MRRARLFSVCILALFLVLSIGMISANTLVAGKIYNSDYSGNISGVSISVVCGSGSETTTSKDDGTYFVVFGDSVCNSGETATISATTDSLSGTGDGLVINCDGSKSCTDSNYTLDFYSIVNAPMKAIVSSPSSSGGGGGSYTPTNYYLCGNGVCDTGETPTTCPQDCHAIAPTSSNENSNQTSNETTTGTQTHNGFLGITGGAIGAFATSGPGIALILLIVLAALIIIFLSLKKKKA